MQNMEEKWTLIHIYIYIYIYIIIAYWEIDTIDHY